MKKLTIIFLLFIGLGFILSCEKELRDPKLDMNGTTNPAITNPQNGTAFILTEDEQDNVFTNFQWSATGYSLSNLESTKYELSMDEAGSNFADPDILTITTDLNFEMTVLAINQRLITRGLGVDTAHDMEFKLRSYVNDASDYTEAGSEVTTLSLTPYEASAPPPPTEPTLWIPGDYQGWSPETAPVIYSYTDDGVFKGYMWMPEGGTYEFKFTSAPDWDHTNFGFAGEGLLDPDANAGNLTMPGPGGYQVVVDTVNLTWTNTLESWGVIGQWLDWADDIDMEWDAVNQYLVLTIDVPEVVDNRFKFRADDDWTVNLGAKDPDDGTLVQDGADIPLPDPGNYTFILDFKTEEPTYQLIQN